MNYWKKTSKHLGSYILGNIYTFPTSQQLSYKSGGLHTRFLPNTWTPNFSRITNPPFSPVEIPSPIVKQPLNSRERQFAKKQFKLSQGVFILAW